MYFVTVVILWYLPAVLIHSSLKISEVDSLFIYLLALLYILGSICPSLFLLLVCGSLHILSKSPLSDVYILNILSQLVACFFTFLMEAFDE